MPRGALLGSERIRDNGHMSAESVADLFPFPVLDVVPDRAESISDILNLMTDIKTTILSEIRAINSTNREASLETSISQLFSAMNEMKATIDSLSPLNDTAPDTAPDPTPAPKTRKRWPKGEKKQFFHMAFVLSILCDFPDQPKRLAFLVKVLHAAYKKYKRTDPNITNWIEQATNLSLAVRLS